MDEKRLNSLAKDFQFSPNPLVQELVTEIRRCWGEIEGLKFSSEVKARQKSRRSKKKKTS